MQQISQPIDHGHVRELRELLDVLMREGADHDAVNVARQHARRVGDRLAAAELYVARREKERVPAKLVGAHFEGDTRSRGRFHEDHREGLPSERLARVFAAAHSLGEVEEREQLGRGEVGDREEVAVLGRGHRGLVRVSGNQLYRKARVNRAAAMRSSCIDKSSTRESLWCRVGR